MRLVAILALAMACGAAGPAVAPAPARSGYADLPPDLKAMQDDSFLNPGMLWVDEGAKAWAAAPSGGGKACAGCHGEAARSMKGVAARYPAHDAKAGRVVNLEQRINMCRAKQGAQPAPYDSRELVSLVAFVSRQSLGQPVAVRVDGPARASFERGRAAFFQRIGQLDLSCSDCHDRNAGRRLHGDRISQGQTNGFPIYRQIWGAAASTHRMFAWCNWAVRAEPEPLGSQSYVDLELYVRWRGQGLPVETPAIRK